MSEDFELKIHESGRPKRKRAPKRRGQPTRRNDDYDDELPDFGIGDPGDEQPS